MRVIYNLDCTEFFVGTFGPNLPGTIDAFTDEHAALGITDLFINVNAKRTNYRSSVWEAYWDGYDPAPGDEQPFFDGLDPQRRFETELFKNMLALHDQGCDYPERMIDGARRNRQRRGSLLRMNDDHSPNLPGHPSHSTLWKSHPEWRLSYGLDYEQPGVREHYVKLIEESVRALRPRWSRARFSALLALLPRGARASGGGLDDGSRAASAAGDGPGRDAPGAPGRARRSRTVNSLDRPTARASVAVHLEDGIDSGRAPTVRFPAAAGTGSSAFTSVRFRRTGRTPASSSSRQTGMSRWKCCSTIRPVRGRVSSKQRTSASPHGRRSNRNARLTTCPPKPSATDTTWSK